MLESHTCTACRILYRCVVHCIVTIFACVVHVRVKVILASKPGLLPQFRTQLCAPTIKCVGGKTEGEGLDDFRT